MTPDARSPVVCVVVGHTDLGDSDRVLRLLSAEYGRVSVVARRARDPRARIAPLTGEGTRVRATWRSSKGELGVLKAMELVSAPVVARAELGRLALLLYGCELIGGLSGEAVPNDRLAGLLNAWLDRLEQPVPPGGAARVALEAKALTFAGLAPALTHCAVCGGELLEDICFDAEQGGACHLGCGQGPRVAARLLALAEGLRRTPLAQIGAEPLPFELRGCLSAFCQHQLGRALRSLALVQELETEGEGRG